MSLIYADCLQRHAEKPHVIDSPHIHNPLWGLDEGLSASICPGDAGMNGSLCHSGGYSLHKKGVTL
jgi:hypothetical protein